MRNKAICMWQYLKLNEKINKTSKFVGCSIIMLVMSWARNGQGTCMGPYSLWWAPQTFPRLESMLYLDHLLWFLLWLQENTLQQETIRELWTRQLLTGCGGYTLCMKATQWCHRESGREYRLEALPLLGSESGLPRILQVHFLLENLKQKNRN